MNRNQSAYKILLCCLLLLSCAGTGVSQQRNDKLLNRPYADLRRWHLGFSVGMHTLDFSFTHNGFTTDNGETWFMEQPSFSPGFCVNGLLDVRLNDYFNVRFTPGMYFGNRVVKMHDTTNDAWQQQNIKSNYVVLPVDLKFSATRYHNVRPYLVGGVMGVFDVSKKRPREFLRLKSTDFMLTAGFGCDIYLPYFKLCPEIKFCFGLSDILQHERPDFEDDLDGMKYTNSLKKATTQMVVLSFYFE